MPADRQTPDLRALEGGIFTALNPLTMTQHDVLDELTEQQAEQFHLYAVGWRPRIRIVPGPLDNRGDRAPLNVVVDTPDGPVERVIEIPTGYPESTFEIVSAPPHTFFTLVRDGEPVFEQHVGWWLSQIAFVDRDHEYDLTLHDLEILYVGQAYGDGGSRTARDRLASHSTLQRVYATANLEAPDKEVWILLMGMEGTLQAISFAGSAEPMDDDAAVEELTRLLSADPSLGQRINFTEAALIKYFQPQFNEKFKDNFPHKSHTSYSECYDLDLNSVGFTLDARQTFTRLFSERVRPDYIHAHTFALHSAAERRAMFDFMSPNEPG